MAEEPITWAKKNAILDYDNPWFRYEPLATSDSIRLLYLDHAENPADVLRCELVPVAIPDIEEQHIDFVALSYFW